MEETNLMTFKFGKTERLVVALLAGSIGLLGCGGSSSNGNLGLPYTHI